MDDASEHSRLQVRWDALVSALQEVRAEAFHARDEAHAAREEARNAQDEVRQLQEAGCRLQEAYEHLQQELRDAVGDAAYWKVLVEEGESEPREPRDRGNRCEKASGDWTALRADAHAQAAEAARAEAARWRQLAERRGEELLRLRQQLAAKEAKGAAAPEMSRTLQASEQVKRASLHPALGVPTPARAQARRGQETTQPARGGNAEETCNSSNCNTEYFHIGSPTTQRARSSANGPKSARVHRVARPGAQSSTAVASTAAAAAAVGTRKAAEVRRQASQPTARRPLSSR
eukprot:TRINITY_DN77754_c0_g1_i1.p1 TRINITY_DN77754_c0_g1~~TRINITY_DN77754_c0_g1_i1.p1  ORF type:complete len:308 (+),score=56.80 TRINITY_DN77754_c0_g1_i1:57-926(+)